MSDGSIQSRLYWGYKHLDYRSLDSAAQEFVDKNTLIFSNLFGPVLAADALPEYKLKQG
ncbi:MAG: peroxide stress protein YaaA, partial [Prevotella sp.]